MISPPMEHPLPVAPPPIALATPAKRPWYSWRRLGFNFLTISILVHLLFGAAATFWIVQTLSVKRKLTFVASPPSPTRSTRSTEHRVQMAQKQKTMSAPAQAKRVTTTARDAQVALPQMPAMPALSSVVTPAMMGGAGGAGFGLATMGAPGGGTSGGGGPVSIFGFHGNGAGLNGTFYDYKMNQVYQPVKGMDANVFATIVKNVLPTSGTWHPEKPYVHFTPATKLRGKYFMVPAIQSEEAGAAFQSPRSGPGLWLAVYRGSFSSPVSGTFRFVGFGDNVMVVKLDNSNVLDASDHNYTGARHEELGNISFPNKDATPLYAGEWFQLTANETRSIAVAVGDEGGIFCAGLFIQPKETPYVQGDRGVPKLPLFVLGTLTEADRQLLDKALPPDCLRGPFFRAEAAHSTGLFDD
jgi:hypothetical protein